MPGGVREALGDHEIDRRLDKGRRPVEEPHVDVHGHGAARSKLVHRGAEPALGECRGVDAPGERPQLDEGHRHPGRDIVEVVGECGVAIRPRPSADHAQVDGDRHELLLRPVVEVAFEPGPGVISRLDDPQPRFPHVLKGVLESVPESLVVDREAEGGRDAVEQAGVLGESHVMVDHRERALARVDLEEGAAAAAVAVGGGVGRLPARIEVPAGRLVPPEHAQGLVVEGAGEALLPDHPVDAVPGDHDEVGDARAQVAGVGHPRNEGEGNDGDRHGGEEEQPGQRGQAHEVAAHLVDRHQGPAHECDREDEGHPPRRRAAENPAHRDPHGDDDDEQEAAEPPQVVDPLGERGVGPDRVGVGDARALGCGGRIEQERRGESHREESGRHRDDRAVGLLGEATGRIAEDEDSDEDRPPRAERFREWPEPPDIVEHPHPGRGLPDQRHAHHQPADEPGGEEPPRDDGAHGIDDAERDVHHRTNGEVGRRVLIEGEVDRLCGDVRRDREPDDGEPEPRFVAEVRGVESDHGVSGAGRAAGGRRGPGGGPRVSCRSRACPGCCRCGSPPSSG